MAQRRTIHSQDWSVSSAGPFAAASNLSVGSGIVVVFFSLAHLTASARFRAGPPGGPYPAGYAGRPPGGADHRVPVSRCVSAAGISLLGHPMPAEELGSPHGRLTGPKAGPRRGYRFPHVRAAAGVGASYTPRTAVLLPAEGRARPALPLFRGESFDPAPTFPSTRGYELRGISRRFRFFTRPACPSPVAPGWVGRPWTSLELRTTPLPAAHVEGGARSLSTDPELLDHIRPILQSGSSLVSCDRRRTVQLIRLVERPSRVSSFEKAEVELEHDQLEPRSRIGWLSERLAAGAELTAQIRPHQ